MNCTPCVQLVMLALPRDVKCVCFVLLLPFVDSAVLGGGKVTSHSLPGLTVNLSGSLASESANKGRVWYLLPNGTAQIEKACAFISRREGTFLASLQALAREAFLRVYRHFEDTCANPRFILCSVSGIFAALAYSFDFKLYSHFLGELERGAATRRERDAYTSFAYYPKGRRLLPAQIINACILRSSEASL